MSQTEEWRSAVGYAGLYEVSSFGRVRTLTRRADNQGNRGRQIVVGRMLSPSGERYLTVKLTKNKMAKDVAVHQLVLEAFDCPRPVGMVARHFPDRSTRNNRADNLRWGTPAENQADRIVHGTSNLGRPNLYRTPKAVEVAVRTEYGPVNRYARGRVTQRALAQEVRAEPRMRKRNPSWRHRDMSVIDQKVTDRYALYLGDNMEVLPSLPDGSIHLSVYSPPFAQLGGGAMYHYSSSERDLSNARTYSEFFEQYRFVVAEIARATMPGRVTAVHCMDVPTGNTGHDALNDFPGDIIRLHRDLGLDYIARYCVWKEPLGVRNRTLAKNLAHRTIVDDSSRCSVASADYLLVFRARGENPVPIAHPTGLTEYAGERQVPAELTKYRGWTGKQIENRYSHWIWRQYASAFWDDIRIGRVLPFRDSRDEEDEKHMHPLQLDVIQRCLQLWSNPGERVLTPFAGVGSEVYEAVRSGRFGIGVELKPSYFRQAVKNLDAVDADAPAADEDLFAETWEAEEL